MKRYYNLKKGRPDINGAIIEVNLDARLEKRVRNFIYNTRASLLGYGCHKGLYSLDLNETHSLRPILELHYSLRPKFAVTLEVSDKGDLKIHKKQSSTKVYLEEITRKQANEKRDDAENWSKLQAWV